MTRNLTLRLDEAVLKHARLKAVEQDLSLSQWVADLIATSVASDHSFAAAKRRALRRLDRAFKLGGKPLTREQAHER